MDLKEKLKAKLSESKNSDNKQHGAFKVIEEKENIKLYRSFLFESILKAEIIKLMVADSTLNLIVFMKLNLNILNILIHTKQKKMISF